MDKILLGLAVIIIIAIIFFLKGVKEVYALGYRRYPETTPKKWIQGFQKSTIIKLVGTTQKNGLFVFRIIRENEEDLPCIIMDIVNYIPAELLHIGASYQVFVSEKTEQKIFVQKYSKETTQEMFERYIS